MTDRTVAVPAALLDDAARLAAEVACWPDEARSARDERTPAEIRAAALDGLAHWIGEHERYAAKRRAEAALTMLQGGRA